MADDIAIKVSNISKTFVLPHEKNSSVKNAFINFYKKKKGYEKQQVLNDISFEIKKGEFFGIVGRNGSGKSTLLKLLAGIYTPDSGDIQISGKLTPFIELGVGFNPELSGRENVFLNGALLGFNRKEMEAMYDEIVEFAELERFMDQKLKNYSSGMQVRLAFSIAIRANTDILVLDEVLAVGDAGFQKKCTEYFHYLKKSKKTVILVSHSMRDVREFCEKAVLIEDGEIVSQGDTDSVVSDYLQINRDLSSKALEKINKNQKRNLKDIKKEVVITEVKCTGSSASDKSVFRPRDRVRISCTIVANSNVRGINLRLRVSNENGPAILALHTERKLTFTKGETKIIEWELENILNDGAYIIGGKVFDTDTIVVDQIDEAYRFEVEGWDSPYSIVHPVNKVKVSSRS